MLYAKTFTGEKVFFEAGRGQTQSGEDNGPLVRLTIETPGQPVRSVSMTPKEAEDLSLGLMHALAQS